MCLQLLNGGEALAESRAEAFARNWAQSGHGPMLGLSLGCDGTAGAPAAPGLGFLPDLILLLKTSSDGSLCSNPCPLGVFVFLKEPN